MWRKIKENKLILLLLLIGAVYFLLKFIVPLLAPVLLAMLFVTIFGPLMQYMQKRLRIHRQLAAAALLLLAGSLLAVLLWVLFSWMVGSFPEWMTALERMEQDLSGRLGLDVYY